MLKHSLLLLILLIVPVFGQQSALPNEPVTLQKLNLMLRREVGRNMTEAELAIYIQRVGIDFDPTPEAVSRLRANGAHQHLINTIKREARKLVEAGGKVVPIGPQAKDPFIEEVRSVVREYLDELPDFICNQVVERYYDFEARGAWDRADTLTYELTYNRKRETYKPINVIGRPVTRPLDQAGGAYSTGDFASGLATLFDPESGAVFRPAGKERLGKRPTLLYDFTVPQETSKLSVKAENFPPIVAGYTGTVWIDEETKHVLRIDQAVDDLPAGFPVTNSESSVDYDNVTLRGLDVEFLLPIRAEFIISDRRKRQYFRNLLYFKFYRKFETDIKISEEEPPPTKPPGERE